ncbi:(deoxy)nucleoside triphosphate pyrophosphohydrolase [Sinomonas sp. P10A9]|uniref:8-oxo-dGTP diphosphatase n=1 Tax=Sinomonas puerhi TaxID=3238584 RepID=A0AB39L9I5_9MICC
MQTQTEGSAEPADNGGLLQVVGGAIVDSLERPVRLLVARRTAPEAFAGMWEFPGGKVEAGEAPEDGLRRELREELGVGVVLGDEIPGPLVQGWPLSGAAAMRVWVAAVHDGAPAPLEDHDELRWVELDGDRIMDLPWIPADLPIVDALRRHLA